MLAHDITTNMTDSSGKLLALDFETGRVVVRWGSGYATHTSVYQRFADAWGGHWRYVHIPQSWRGSPERAAADLGFGRIEDRRSELEVSAHGRGPGVHALSRWLRGEYVRIRAEQEAKAAEAAAIRPSAGKYTSAQQDQFAALRFDSTLPTRILCMASISKTRVLACFLGALKKRLTHGEEIFEFGVECHDAIVSPADVDAVVHVAVALGLAKPYDYEPRSPVTQDGMLTQAQANTWRKHGRGVWDQHALVCGSQFWIYAAGPRLAEAPGDWR